MALRKLNRNAAQDRPDRPAGGRHRGSRLRKVRRERVPDGGRHMLLLEPARHSRAS